MEFEGMAVLLLIRQQLMFAMVQYGCSFNHCLRAMVIMLKQGINTLWVYVDYSKVPTGGTLSVMSLDRFAVSCSFLPSSLTVLEMKC